MKNRILSLLLLAGSLAAATAQYNTNRPSTIGGSGSVSTNRPGVITAPTAGVTTLSQLYVRTNALGASVNLALAGVIPNTTNLTIVASNTIIFSNLLAVGGTVLIPAGVWNFNPIIKQTNTPKSVIRGAGDLTIWSSRGATNKWAFQCFAPNCVVMDLQFNPNQNVPAFSTNWCWINDAGYNNPIPNGGGGLWMNAVGFPLVDNVTFASNAATAFYFEGDRNISNRSNHLAATNIRLWRNYNGMVGGPTNATEYCMADGIIGSENVNYAISFEDANFKLSHVSLNDWQDGYAGTNLVYGVVTGTQLRYRTRVGRTHSTVEDFYGNHAAMGCDIRGNVVTGENFKLVNCNFGGCASNRISDFSQIDISKCHFEGYDTNIGTIITNITVLDYNDNYVRGLIHSGEGFSLGRRNFHFGLGNYLAGTGKDTNDYAYALGGGAISLTTFTKTASSVGGSSWAMTVTAGGGYNQAFTTDGLIRANVVRAVEGFGFPERAWFRPAGDDYVFSTSGTVNNAQLYNWTQNTWAGLGVGKLFLPATNAPVHSTFGAQMFTDGTNICAVFKNAAGVLATNRLVNTNY